MGCRNKSRHARAPNYYAFTRLRPDIKLGGVFARIPWRGVFECGDDIKLYYEVFKDYKTEVASLKEGKLRKLQVRSGEQQNFKER